MRHPLSALVLPTSPGIAAQAQQVTGV